MARTIYWDTTELVDDTEIFDDTESFDLSATATGFILTDLIGDYYKIDIEVSISEAAITTLFGNTPETVAGIGITISTSNTGEIVLSPLDSTLLKNILLAISNTGEVNFTPKAHILSAGIRIKPDVGEIVLSPMDASLIIDLLLPVAGAGELVISPIDQIVLADIILYLANVGLYSIKPFNPVVEPVEDGSVSVRSFSSIMEFDTSDPSISVELNAIIYSDSGSFLIDGVNPSTYVWYYSRRFKSDSITGRKREDGVV
jgi:hypothetical protein